MTIFSNPFSIGSLKEYAQRWLGVKRLSLGLGGGDAHGPMSAEIVLQNSAAWACVRLISESIATLPLSLYETTSKGRVLARSHPLNFVIHTQPNIQSTAVTFWQAYMAGLMLRGKAYCEKTFDSKGRVVGLEFLNIDALSSIRREDGTKIWKYIDNARGTTREIEDAAIWYVPAFTMDGREGISPIRAGTEVFGAARDANSAARKMFGKGLRSSGMVNVNRTLDEPQREKLRGIVQSVADNGGVMVMEKGDSFSRMSLDPIDAELLNSRKYGVEEVCRWFQVPPFMVGHAGGGQTNWGSGIEQQMIGFITFVLRPWCVRIEQAIAKDLLTPSEKSKFKAEFSMEGLLRGDSAARALFYQIMVRNGIYTRDNVREKENMLPMEGNAAILTIESNMVPLDDLGKTDPPSDAAAAALKSWLMLPNPSENGDNPSNSQK